jgi:hypothetical protein
LLFLLLSENTLSYRELEIVICTAQEKEQKAYQEDISLDFVPGRNRGLGLTTLKIRIK